MNSEDMSKDTPQDAPADQYADAELPPPAIAGEGRLSRRGALLAMGAVALAIALVWMAPGTQDSHGEGESAPLHFTLKDMNGVDVKLASFKGKVILVNFWATWCGPCELEIPWLVELQKAYRDDLVVLGVSIDDTAEQLKPYAATKKMNYPVLVGLDRQDVQDAFGPLFGIPVSVFIDRNGTIVRRHSGIATKEQFEKEIKQLL
jgi:thiol-disulfide isomerase/thioredoxin